MLQCKVPSICDLHTHCAYSFDGATTLAEYCACAVERGVGIVATTDHCDMNRVPGENFEQYISVEGNRRRDFEALAAGEPGCELLYGIEIGNAIDMPEETERFLAARSFDFVLGAIHFLSDGTDIYKLPFASQQEIDAMFRDYFTGMRRLTALGGFDSLAHLNYPLRKLQGKVPDTSMERWRDMIEPILENLVKNDIALEINTRGAYDWQDRVDPEPWTLLRYRELGGRRVTIGSDAHNARLVGEGFAEATKLLRQCGFDGYTIYRGRKPFEIPLENISEEGGLSGRTDA